MRLKTVNTRRKRRSPVTLRAICSWTGRIWKARGGGLPQVHTPKAVPAARAGLPLFTQREVLYHYDSIPCLLSASTNDGRMWGGMMLAPGDGVIGLDYPMVMFLIDPEDFAEFESPKLTVDLLEGNYLRNLMMRTRECWLVEWYDNASQARFVVYRKTNMFRDALPTFTPLDRKVMKASMLEAV